MVTFRYLQLLPVIAIVALSATFLITYLMAAICQKSINVFFPYISDTGTYPPQSCIFGQMLNFISLLGLIIYIRKRQLDEVMDINNIYNKTLSRNNVAAFWIGIAACIGVSVVANFQITNQLQAHLLGAVAAFGFGSIYSVLQWDVGRRLYPSFGTTIVNYIRLVISVLNVIFFLLTLIFAVFARLQFKGKDLRLWSEEDGGFLLHLCSVFSEWLCALGFGLFFLTFYSEFQQISISEPDVTFLASKNNHA